VVSFFLIRDSPAVKFSLETKARDWALLMAALSLSGALLLGEAIRLVTASDPTPAAATMAELTSEKLMSPDLTNQGREFYEMSCSDCHGDDAHGDEGPDLYNLAISNARIAVAIRKGIKGQMPAFAKKYNDRQITALVSYLRTLR
jgi:mono/diheme cytochrome c family protein